MTHDLTIRQETLCAGLLSGRAEVEAGKGPELWGPKPLVHVGEVFDLYGGNKLQRFRKKVR